MIPVAPQPEPPDFDAKVRQPGIDWLQKTGLPLDAAPVNPGRLPPYWRETQKELWEAYRGTCAYLSIFFEWPLGASSTDHFVAKSRNAGQAYEWSNYRLSCLGLNRKKSRFDNILDPFEIQPDTFFLNLASGEISPNPALSEDQKDLAIATIARLGLNDPATKQMRARHYSHYEKGLCQADFLKMISPFVWYEASRQNLLKENE